MRTLPYYILDLRGLILHAYHACRDPEPLFDEEGKPVTTAHAGFGAFLEMYLLPLLQNAAPRQVLAVTEGGNDYRQMLFAGYKAKRSAREKSQVLAEQQKVLFDSVQRFMQYLGCNIVNVPGAEADDVIALLVDKLPGQKIVSTVDADLTQMLPRSDLQMLIYGRPVEGDSIRLDGKDGYDVPFKFVRVYKSLLGDYTDEYPGIKGFGGKKWEHVIENFGFDGLEQIEQCVKTRDYTALLEAVNASGDKVLKLIYDNRFDWELQYDLAGLHPEICFRVRNNKPVRPQITKRIPDINKANEVLVKMHCGDMLNKFTQWFTTQTLVTKDNVDMLRFFQQELANSPAVAFDFEGYDTLKHQPYQEAANGRGYVDVLNQKVTGASFTFGNNMQHTFYLSTFHKDTNNLDKEVIVWALKQVKKHGLPLVVQNASYEVTVALNDLGYEIEDPVDTMIMSAYVFESDDSGLKDMSWEYLRYKQTTYEEVLKANDATDMSEVSGEGVLKYGCDDAVCTAALFDLFYLHLVLEDMWWWVLNKEFPVIHPLVDAFMAGVRVDYGRLKELEEEDNKLQTESIAKMRELLAKHCTQVNEQAALVLYNDLAEYETAKMRADNADQEKIDAKLEALKEKCLNGSKYVPYHEYRKPVEFVPTLKKFNDVIAILNSAEHYISETVDLPLPEVTSVTADKLTAWVSDVEDMCVDADVRGASLTTSARRFVDLLAAAAHQLRKREGAEYDALQAYCSEVLTSQSKIESAGDELNFDSPVQMQHMLYCKLALPIRVRSKVQMGSGRDKLGFDGAPATDDKAVAQALVDDCPEGDWRREVLLAFREAKKAITRYKFYYKPYPLWRDPKTELDDPNHGVMHPQIKNCGTITRRPSGTAPNLLQVTKKDEGRLRGSFPPRRKDDVIVSIDFNGQELRITASESKDPVLLDAYIGEVRKDIHSVTASSIASIVMRRDFPHLTEMFTFDSAGAMPYEAFVKNYKNELTKEEAEIVKSIMAGHKGSGVPSGITDDERALVLKNDIHRCLKKARNTFAKPVNFLIVYGGRAGTLARNLGIPRELAQAIMDQVLRMYMRIEPWQQEVVEFAKRHGYVMTAYGNRRHVSEDLFSDDGAKRMREERQVINSTIQSCAADILKHVLSEARKTRLFQETNSILIAPIYDEITSSVNKAACIEYIRRIIPMMEVTPPGHAVPMVAEVSIGHESWGEQIELGANPSDEAILAALEGKKLEKKAA